MIKWKRSGKSILLSIAIGAILIVLWSMYRPAELGLDANDVDLVGLGRKVYSSQCATCHGVNLEGQPNWRVRSEDGKLPAPPHDKTGHTWHHSDTLLISLTQQGPKSVAGPDYKTDMPAYESTLSDKEVIAVLSYIKSTWPEDVRKRHDSLNKPKG